jgi:hypothetical protein
MDSTTLRSRAVANVTQILKISSLALPKPPSCLLLHAATITKASNPPIGLLFAMAIHEIDSISVTRLVMERMIE